MVLAGTSSISYTPVYTRKEIRMDSELCDKREISLNLFLMGKTDMVDFWKSTIALNTVAIFKPKLQVWFIQGFGLYARLYDILNFHLKLCSTQHTSDMGCMLY